MPSWNDLIELAQPHTAIEEKKSNFSNNYIN